MEQGLLLVDQAEFLNVTPSIVSGVELGRKSIPDAWIPLVTQFLKLDAKKQKSLEKTIQQTREMATTAPSRSEDISCIAAYSNPDTPAGDETKR